MPAGSFHRGDAPGADQPSFDDSGWRTLDVPHDWSIEGPFDEKNPTGRGGGFLPAGVGWYRQLFRLPAGLSGQRVEVEFGGIMANSRVWINGHLVGSRPSGYVGVNYDLTEYVHTGDEAPNLLAVRVDNLQQPASRWYTGAGIYDRVRLNVTDPLHFAAGGIFVTTPDVSSKRATIHVKMEVANQSDSPREFTLRTEIVDPEGSVVGTAESRQALGPQLARAFDAEVVLADPHALELG